MLIVNPPKPSDRALSPRRIADRGQLEQPTEQACHGRSTAIRLAQGVPAVDLARLNGGQLNEAVPTESLDANLCRHRTSDRNSAGYTWKRRCLGDVQVRIEGKWTIFVLAALGSERRRFKALQRAINGISQRMLTVTLRVLERDGVVVRTVYSEVPRASSTRCPIGAFP